MTSQTASWRSAVAGELMANMLPGDEAASVLQSCNHSQLAISLAVNRKVTVYAEGVFVPSAQVS